MTKRRRRPTMANHLRHIAGHLEYLAYGRYPGILREAAKEIFATRAQVSDLKAARTRMQRARAGATIGRMPITREALERAVTGALRSAINDHGPITADKLTSATKRVVGNLVNAGLSVEGPEKPPSDTPKKPS